MRYYPLIINAYMSIWFWPFLSSCILTWPVTIMNHPKDALKEAQRQSATSHRPGVRKVEKGQFKMPIGYTTQMKSLFHIHSYLSLKNLPLRFDLPKSKTIHQNVYQNDSNDPQHLMIFGSQIIPPPVPVFRIHDGATITVCMIPWWKSNENLNLHGGNNAENAENAARNFSRTPFVGRADPNLTEQLHSKHVCVWKPSYEYGNPGMGAPIKWLKMHGEPAVIPLIGG